MNNKIIWFFFFLSFTDDVDGDDDGILEIFKSSRESFGGGNKESGKYDNFRWLIIFKRELMVMISEILATFIHPNTENNFAKIRSGKWQFWWHVCVLLKGAKMFISVWSFFIYFSRLVIFLLWLGSVLENENMMPDQGGLFIQCQVVLHLLFLLRLC